LPPSVSGSPSITTPCIGGRLNHSLRKEFDRLQAILGRYYWLLHVEETSQSARQEILESGGGRLGGVNLIIIGRRKPAVGKKKY